MINAGSDVWVERAGTLERVDCPVDPTHVEQLIRRLAASGGRRIDRSSPSVDVRLTDGSRLHAILPPLAIDGPALTIRRFSVRHLELAELTTPDQLELLVDAVAKRATIVIAGATSSGKTTLLNALGAHVSDDERLVTVEDAAELRIPKPHVVRLEARLESSTLPAVSIRELVRHALRMRPDRIICGEMRGAEALDLIQAMNTGHRGSLTTVHANSPADALRRIETMMLLGDADLPLRAVREQLAACIDVIVMMGRTEGAGRSVMTVAEVPERGAGDTWTTTTLADRDAVRNAPSRPWSTPTREALVIPKRTLEVSPNVARVDRTEPIDALDRRLRTLTADLGIDVTVSPLLSLAAFAAAVFVFAGRLGGTAVAIGAVAVVVMSPVFAERFAARRKSRRAVDALPDHCAALARSLRSGARWRWPSSNSMSWAVPGRSCRYRWRDSQRPPGR